MTRGRRGRAVLPVLAAVVVAAGLGWLIAGGADPGDGPPPAPPSPAPSVTDAAPEPQAVTQRMMARPAAAPASAAPGAGAPLTEAERSARRSQWQARLARARSALEGYQQAARYPHESRPMSEHPDQGDPFAPVVEERALRMPGGTATQGVRLVTSQERIFMSGSEASRVTLSLRDMQDRALPLLVTRAVLHEVTEPGRTASTPEFVAAVNDAGQSGDAVAGDGIFTAWVQPALQGFGGFAGLLRLELHLDHAGQPGFIFFDFIYSPELAARWLPGVRESLNQGSLEFHLKAEVLIAGRYVVSARVDDATGRSFALALFNGELGRGTQEIRLPVFGKLVRDERPAFPLRLRDVDAFLLKPDTHPDRVMLPRLAGVVHTSRRYTLADFSDAPWSSEERERYLAELQRDVDQAQQELDKLGP